MKKFMTVIPFQVAGQLRRYKYIATGNSRLQMDAETSFPILTAVNGYVEQNEPFEIVALTPDTEDGRRNFGTLSQQLQDLCARKGLLPEQAKLTMVMVDNNDLVSTHVAAFQRLIDTVEDNDELFACITFGTKPLSQAVIMAVQYAYRVKRNTSISCIVYGGIDRSGGPSPDDWIPRVWDETALIQLNEIIYNLAEQGVTNPKAVIDRVLSL